MKACYRATVCSIRLVTFLGGASKLMLMAARKTERLALIAVRGLTAMAIKKKPLKLLIGSDTVISPLELLEREGARGQGGGAQNRKT